MLAIKTTVARFLGRSWLGFALLTGSALHGAWACRPEVPPRFVEHSALAQDAALRGDHVEAARQWQMASEFADLEHVRDEAVYRQATSLERAGEHDASAKILGQLAANPGSRQERAAYDLATRALWRARATVAKHSKPH